MKLKVVRNPSFIRMDLEGNLSIKNASKLEDFLAKFDTGDKHALLLNLERLLNIDSSGLLALKNFSESLKKPHLRFFLVGVNEKQRTIMENAGLLPGLPVLADDEYRMAFTDDLF